jgi:hypothetical protein
MNSIEKRKVKAVINADVSQAIAKYRTTRNQMHEALKEQLEKKLPPAVSDLLAKAKTANAVIESAKAEAKALGWDLKVYSNSVSVSIMTTWSYENGVSRHPREYKQIQCRRRQTGKLKNWRANKEKNSGASGTRASSSSGEFRQHHL